jgi:LuxR family maltose regulon positive regulatory protein
MATPLLASKTRVPDRRPGRVPRERLLERMGPATAARLTVVSAPAGYGKTTLLTEWLAALPADAPPVAWLALDPADDDPAGLWAYLLDAVGRALPGVAAGAAGALAAGEPVDAVVTTLLNDLAAADRDVLLVLDDAHVLRSADVLAGLRLLVEHLPPRVHLVLATRSDPDLPLARLRARGELVEVRAADLRFSAAETAVYLADAGVPLTPADHAAVARRTEGWAAALQLVVLALRDAGDVAAVLGGLHGEHRHLADYLVEEVLRHQSADVRAFLLRTSVLSRLTGPLCDAVVGGSDGAAVLEALDRANLFLVPLDDERRWFRYHHLFAEVLAARLAREQGDAVAALHHRAGRWHAGHGDPAEAVRHALAGGDHERAAELVEAAVPALRRDRRESTLRGWVAALPPDVVGARPALALGQVGALLAEGRTAAAAELLDHVEVGLDAGGPARSAPDAAVAGQAALFRAALAQAAGDGAAVERHARRAADLLGPGDHPGRGAAAGLLGLAAWSRGDLDDAERWWSASHAALERAGHHADAHGAVLALGDIRLAQGRLADAAAGYAQALAALPRGAGGAVPRGAADMHVALAGVLRERGELEAAREHLAAADALGDDAGLPQNRHRRRVAGALLQVAAGDVAGAVALLDQAERAYVADFFPDVRPVAAVRAGVQARAGLLDPARQWARERRAAPGGERDYLHEYEHLTLARVLLAEHRAGGAPDALADAGALLDRLLPAADAGGRTGSVIEALVLRALVSQAAGDLPAALAGLDRAVRLAADRGHVRVLMDEGAPVAALLGVLALRADAPAHVATLLAAAGTTDADGTEVPVPARSTAPDALTARERAVLRLLATELAGPEIARHLGLSLNTVRTHTTSVYRKLGVHGRRAAVRRADELGLLRGDG